MPIHAITPAKGMPEVRMSRSSTVISRFREYLLGKAMKNQWLKTRVVVLVDKWKVTLSSSHSRSRFISYSFSSSRNIIPLNLTRINIFNYRCRRDSHGIRLVEAGRVVTNTDGTNNSCRVPKLRYICRCLSLRVRVVGAGWVVTNAVPSPDNNAVEQYDIRFA